jgi:hypothetical protein
VLVLTGHLTAQIISTILKDGDRNKKAGKINGAVNMKKLRRKTLYRKKDQRK